MAWPSRSKRAETPADTKLLSAAPWDVLGSPVDVSEKKKERSPAT